MIGVLGDQRVAVAAVNDAARIQPIAGLVGIAVRPGAKVPQQAVAGHEPTMDHPVIGNPNGRLGIQRKRGVPVVTVFALRLVGDRELVVDPLVVVVPGQLDIAAAEIMFPRRGVFAPIGMVAAAGAVGQARDRAFIGERQRFADRKHALRGLVISGREDVGEPTGVFQFPPVVPLVQDGVGALKVLPLARINRKRVLDGGVEGGEVNHGLPVPGP